MSRKSWAMHILDQCFSSSGNCDPRGHLAMSEDFYFWSSLLGKVTGSQCVETIDAAKYPTMPRTTHTTNKYPASNINNARLRNLFQDKRIASNRENSKKMTGNKKRTEGLSILISSCYYNATTPPQNLVVDTSEH